MDTAHKHHGHSPAIAMAACVTLSLFCASARAEQINFIYTSDLHYGITKTNFDGSTNVGAQAVNEAMIDKMNAMPNVALPNGQKVGAIDFVAITGDIANRAETGIQSATASWNQFQSDFLGNNLNTAGGRLNLTTSAGAATPLYLLPGNHDISNAIGYPTVTKDATSVVQIYNRMAPYSGQTPITNATYSYPTDRLNYSVDVGGVHMMFVNMWPDRAVQQWMNTDLTKVAKDTPTLLFTHAPINPAETKVFGDPANPTKTAQGVIPYTLGTGPNQYTSFTAAAAELTTWLKDHPEVKAYFAGHDNFSEFGTQVTDPATGAAISTFRVDSPMKGNVSASDETKLSFDVFTIDTDNKTLTAREYLWNSTGNAATSGAWGTIETIAIPEPSTYATAAGLLGLALAVWKRRQRAA